MSEKDAWDAWRSAWKSTTGADLPAYYELDARNARSWSMFVAKINAAASEVESKVLRLEKELSEARSEVEKLKAIKYIAGPSRVNVGGQYERLDFIRRPLTEDDALQSHDAEFASLFSESLEIQEAVRVILERDEAQVPLKLYRPSKQKVS